MQKIGSITPTADVNGEWTNGNVAGGTPPTIIDAAWLNTVQRELINILTVSGITIDPTDDNQVMAALAGYFLKNSNNLSEIKTTGVTAQEAARTNIGAAALAGLATQLFSVAEGAADAHAVNLKQLTGIISALSLGTASRANIGNAIGQIPDMSSFAASSAAAGYFKLPGGIIVQWGSATTGSDGSIFATYPVAFPTRVFIPLCTNQGNFPTGPVAASATGLVSVRLSCLNSSGTGVSGVSISYLAIGD